MRAPGRGSGTAGGGESLLVAEQGVAVVQPAGERRAADRTSRGELPHELLGGRHFDDAVVVLVGDQDVTVLQQLGAVRVVELVGFGVVGSDDAEIGRASCRERV